MSVARTHRVCLARRRLMAASRFRVTGGARNRLCHSYGCTLVCSELLKGCEIAAYQRNVRNTPEGTPLRAGHQRSQARGEVTDVARRRPRATTGWWLHGMRIRSQRLCYSLRGIRWQLQTHLHIDLVARHGGAARCLCRCGSCFRHLNARRASRAVVV
eukprot:SAG11_NODE_5554_length_1526_cov_2.779958_1_plen_158_part_00